VEEQRKQFLREEEQKVRIADVEDRDLAKKKKREKKERRKQLEREAMEAEMVGSDNDGEGLELPGWCGSEDEGLAEEMPERPSKRKKEQRLRVEDEPETLEDLEALAAGLLG